MIDKQSKLHKYLRKPDDPRYSRLDTLANELENAGVPRLVVFPVLYALVAIAAGAVVAVILAALWGVWENLARPLFIELDRLLLSPALKLLGPLGIFLLFLAICVVAGIIKGLMENRTPRKK